jgi:hypothetical protein
VITRPRSWTVLEPTWRPPSNALFGTSGQTGAPAQGLWGEAVKDAPRDLHELPRPGGRMLLQPVLLGPAVRLVVTVEMAQLAGRPSARCRMIWRTSFNCIDQKFESVILLMR